jgi:hypothetical protein
MKGAVQDGGALGRIAALLLALALVAERAAGRSFPIRFVVLAILGRAEAIARAYVAREIEADCPDWPCPDWPCPDWPCPDLLAPDESPAMRYGTADAELLALRLRMLAALLGMLAGADDRLIGRAAGGCANCALRPAPAPIVLLFFPAHRPPLPHDTS